VQGMALRYGLSPYSVTGRVLFCWMTLNFVMALREAPLNTVNHGSPFRFTSTISTCSMTIAQAPEYSISRMINDLAVDILRHSLVKTAVSRFHVKNWNLPPP